MARRYCTATAANGAPCKRAPALEKDVCPFHDPSASANAKHKAETVQCRGTKTNGEPCNSTLGLSPTGLCLNHDPERQEIAREVRVAGGRASGAAKRNAHTRTPPSDVPPPPKTLDDAVRYFAYLTHAVTSGTLDARSAHEAAYSLNGFKAAVEKRDLEREIKALRKQLDELKQLPARVS